MTIHVILRYVRSTRESAGEIYKGCPPYIEGPKTIDIAASQSKEDLMAHYWCIDRIGGNMEGGGAKRSGPSWRVNGGGGDTAQLPVSEV